MDVNIADSNATVTVDSELTTDDLDTGAGTDTRAVMGLVGSASGGGELIPGSATNGLLVNLGANNDVTVTGTVTANAGTGDFNVNLQDGGGTDLTSTLVGGDQSLDVNLTQSVALDASAATVTVDSELPAAAALSDAFANPTAPAIGAFNMGFDGTDWERLRTTNTGQLHVSIQEDSVGIGGGTQYAVDAALGATPTGTLTLFKRDDVLSSLGPVEEDAIEGRVDSTGAIWTRLTAGSAEIGTLGANSGTDIGDVDVTSVVPGTGATNLGKAIDTATGATDTGVLLLATRDDTLSALTPAEGDNVQLRVSSTGALHVTGGGGGTEYTVNAAAPADPTGTASLMERDDALSTLTEVEADWTNMRSNARGALWVELDLTNDVTIADGGNTITVDGTVTANAGTGDFNVNLQDGGGTDLTSTLVGADQSLDVNLTQSVALDASAATVTVDSELPAAAALSDAFANPTAPAVGSFLMGFDGTDWERARVTNTGQIHVSIQEDAVGIGGGTQYTEDAAAPADPVGNALMVTRDDALSAVTEAEGDWSRVRGTAEGAMWVQDFNSDAILADTANMDTNLGTVAGAVSGSEMQVDIVSGNVTNAGTFATQVDGAALTALQLIDNIVTTEDSASGNGDSGVVTLARRTATPADTSGADLDYEALQMDNGRLWTSTTVDAALPAGDNNIGNVDIASSVALDVSSATVTTTPAVVGGGTEAAAQRVTIANNSTGVLSVDDNGGSLTIDGTVTANAGTGNFNVNLQDGAGTDLSSTNSGLFVTGDEGNDIADAGNPIKIGGRAQSSEAQPEEVEDNDRVDALFDRSGYFRVRGDFDPSFADINDATSGNNTIVAAAGAGKRIAVWAILIVSDGTTDVRWEDGAGGTAFTGQVPLQAREGYSISAGGIVPLFVGSANTLLNLELTAAINCHGFVSYTVMDD
jgi:translation initiation factor IF-1